MPTPMRTLQVAVTAAALVLSQAPAHAQGPAAPPPGQPPAAEPPPTPAPPPAVPLPPPPADTRAPSQELPTEAQPLPPWQPSVEQPSPGPLPPTDQPPADQPPPSDVAAPLTGEGAAEPPPSPEPPPAAPIDTVKANKLRRAGAGVMITGGAIAFAGFALTLVFTLRGNKFEKDLIGIEGQYQQENCSRDGGSQCDALTAQRQDTRDGILNSDHYTKISGGILGAGILVTAIGGIVYRRGMKQLGTANTARIRVSPTFGGLTLSGRF